MQLLVGETSPEQAGDQLFGNEVALAFANGQGSLLTRTRRNINGLYRPSSFHQLETDEHQGGFASTLVPSGHVDEEITRGVRHGRVVPVDDGREGEDVVVVVQDQRISLGSIQQMCVFRSFGVVFQNLFDRHRLVASEGDKGSAFRNGDHAKRGAQFGQIMDANGDPSPTSTDGEMQFLLMVHQALDEEVEFIGILWQIDASNDGTMNHRANGAEARVHTDGDAAWRGGHVGLGWCVVQERSHGKGQGFAAQQIWTVGKYFDVEGFLGASVNVRSQQRQLFVCLTYVVSEPTLLHQRVEERLRDGYGGHVFTYRANQWGIGRP